MMEDNFKQLADALLITPLSIDVLRKITLLINQQTPASFSSFVSQSTQYLLDLEHWAWKRLSHDSYQWINQPDYVTLFHTLASFNKNLIFNYDTTEDEVKSSLLIPTTVDQINGIFEQINRSNDDNDIFIGLASLWFDNLSFFIHENPRFDTSPVICYINQYIGRSYLMTDQFKFYLTQLQQSQILQSHFSTRKLFYIKTCSFSLSSYLMARIQNYPFNAEEMLHYIGHECLQIINIHSHTIESWNNELFMCIAHLTGIICACCWWDRKKSTQTKILFRTEQVSCDFAQALIRVLSYQPFYKEIKAERLNNETIFIDMVLKFILVILQSQNINWFFRSNLSLPNTLLMIAENSAFDEICILTYAILGEVLTDEKLKELKVTDDIADVFYNMLEQGWRNPLKKYKQITVLELLRGFSSLAKCDSIQQKLAKSQRLSLLIEMCDQYPITFDILWALSFNQDIQQQLRSNAIFMSKLSHLAKECDNEQMQKITHGLLWNLEMNHEDHTTSEIDDGKGKTFDIMISYSHKDKLLCQQIYDELIRAGYRIWIDFDQMHGNVMDAMAQAIEQSQTVIICMSEEYRKSNYCRAEAHYAFQRQRKIVPVLLQKHYRPDGWLLFLIGQLVYVDFNKYEFAVAMKMLFKELKGIHIVETNTVVLPLEQEKSDTPPKLYLTPILPKNILDWTQTHVQGWLAGHNLNQMSHLLAECNGQSLLYLDEYIRNGDINQILNLLQEDSLRRAGENLSLLELSCFRSFMDEQKQLMESDISTYSSNPNNNDNKNRSFLCCRMM